MYLTERDKLIMDVMMRSGHFEPPEADRVSHEMYCHLCGQLYVHHPQHVPFHFLTVLCDGRTVKL